MVVPPELIIVIHTPHVLVHAHRSGAWVSHFATISAFNSSWSSGVGVGGHYDNRFGVLPHTCSKISMLIRLTFSSFFESFLCMFL